MLDIFSKKTVGLDISNNSIEAVELVKKGNRILISKRSRLPLEKGIVSKGEIGNADKLIKAVKEVFKQAQPEPIITKKIIFALPQTHVYTHNFFLKTSNSKLSNQEIDRLIEREIEKNIPVKPGDLLFSYKVLNRNKKMAEILLAAADKESVIRWDKFFKKLDIVVEDFDVRNLANYRGLFARPVKSTVCLVNRAKSFTDISIFDKEGLCYSNLLSKENYSLTKKPIKKEINKALAFAKRRNQGVNEVILVGNNLKGLADYLHNTLDISVREGYSAVAQANKSIEDILNKSKSVFYLTAIGSALRTLDREWLKRDPAIAIKKKRRIININMFQDNLFKKILIISPLIIAIIVLGVIYFTKPGDNNQAESNESTHQFSQKQSFDLKIVVAADSSVYQEDRVKGRIIENTVSQAADYDEAVAYSRLEVEKELESGERLWLTPISEKKTEFPMTIKWLAYSENDVEKLFLEKLDELNKENTEYSLESIKKNQLRPTINSRLYNLEAAITVSLNNLIQIEEPAEEEVIEEESVEKVTIKETETGWLNVRKGPGTNYEKVTMIYPGEEYELLEESGNWYKIKIDEETEGWIFSSYALKEE